jgi:hypothetical protein
MVRWRTEEECGGMYRATGRDYGPGMKPQMSRRSQQSRGNVQNSVRMTMDRNTDYKASRRLYGRHKDRY